MKEHLPLPLLLARLAVSALAAGLGACTRTELPPEPPRPVLTQVLGEVAGNGESVYSGEVRSRYETQLAFRIPGKITARLVDAGAVVRPGQILARLDPTDTTLSAAAAEAQLALAAADAKRYRELHLRNFVSQAALDGKEVALTAARSQAELAGNQRNYTELRADQAGIVGLVGAEVGQVIAAGQTVFRVARADTLEVAIAIPESRMSEVRPGSAAEITLWADEKTRYRGRLRELTPAADPATRTFAARVGFIEADAKVLLGMSAKVRFPRSDDTKRLSVPLTAIHQHEGGPALWIVSADQTVSLRPVGIASYGEGFALLSDGAAAGERIVVAGVHKLSAGEKIRLAGSAVAR